ncbi:acetamidase/formamidase family protein [Celerinatantimonas sp. MCCC 1A17872]|uniref:acetamidase/formamidase family protein n=1 Tax=Celerinatantimonas sp. MCCC 1A17872 TaxID=3177514 RepID=UPI0038C76BDB
MCQHCLGKTIHDVNHHGVWDNSIEPVMTIKPGETVHFECLDSSGGQITKDSDVSVLSTLSMDLLNPVTGPVYVDGAQPGDILKVSIEQFIPSGFGWSAIIPGFGLLQDQFKDPALHLWHYDRHQMGACAYGDFAHVPLKPFAGTIGVAPAQSGQHSVIPPRQVGGNLDIRDLSAGSTLYLPVEVAGALFSVGDTHAAQGDGEVCGTAIESQMDAVLTFDVIKGQSLKSPAFSTPGPVTAHLDRLGYEVFTGVGSDLMTCAQDALSHTIDWLCRTTQMSAEKAYMLCSVCGDLRISEIVDAPNWVVSFYFPKVVLA